MDSPRLTCLLLGRYSRTGASTRLRHLQYLPYLAGAGISVHSHTLLDDAYLRNRYDGSSTLSRALLGAYVSQLRAVLGSRRYDVVWIEKEVFPMLPAWTERLLHRSGVPYVVDYDDATFHSYDRHPSVLVRRLMGRKIDVVMSKAAAVVAGNAYIAERARRAGARRVEVVPTVVDLDRYPFVERSTTECFTVGWIGTPATVTYLSHVQDALRRIGAARRIQLVTVGAEAAPIEGVRVEHRPWSEETEAAELSAFDVGIMPLSEGPWERGKCGYKLIQYMAAGLPVVASPVGANQEIVLDGENGFLAERTEDWHSALVRLMENPALRREMGRRSRSRVETHYSLQTAGPKMARILRTAAGYPAQETAVHESSAGIEPALIS